MRKLFFAGLMMCALPMMAQQDSFEKFKQQQTAQFDAFKKKQQAEFDAYRKRINEEYADFMRQAWKEFPIHEAEKPKKEPIVEPVVYKPQPKEEKPLPKEDIKPLDTPKPKVETQPVQIAVQPKVMVVPKPAPAPEPIAPVKPKEESYKKVSIGFYGAIITIGFPLNDNLKLRALDENAVADAWTQLSDARYDISVKTALDARKANNLCDWAYLKMLQTVTEKQYG